MFEDYLTFIEFICECGQREQVRIDATGYSVCYEGPVDRDWDHHPCPYQYDPHCIACHRRKRPAIQAFSGHAPDPNPPERAIGS